VTEPNLYSSLQLDVLILLSNSSLLNTVSLFPWLAIVVTARNELNSGALDTAAVYCDFENRASRVQDIWDCCAVLYLYFNLLKCDAAWFRSDMLPPLTVLYNKSERRGQKIPPGPRILIQIYKLSHLRIPFSKERDLVCGQFKIYWSQFFFSSYFKLYTTVHFRDSLTEVLYCEARKKIPKVSKCLKMWSFLTKENFMTFEKDTYKEWKSNLAVKSCHQREETVSKTKFLNWNITNARFRLTLWRRKMK
jgi:hypothetical protein